MLDSIMLIRDQKKILNKFSQIEPIFINSADLKRGAKLPRQRIRGAKLPRQKIHRIRPKE